MNAAQTWESENGSCALRVRGRSERSGADAFFESLGFEFSKTQKVFEHVLQGES